jgi:hypothetical protein
LNSGGWEPHLGASGWEPQEDFREATEEEAKARAEALRHEYRTHEGEYQVREVGSEEWRAVTYSEFTAIVSFDGGFSFRPRPLGDDVSAREVETFGRPQSRRLVSVPENPLRTLVDLIKRNNAELLRLTGHQATEELMAVEAALESMATNEED